MQVKAKQKVQISAKEYFQFPMLNRHTLLKLNSSLKSLAWQCWHLENNRKKCDFTNRRRRWID